MTFFTKYAKHERILFLLLIIANFSFLFIHHFFVTLDGPAHHYNANIISSLLFSGDSVFSKYFELNKEFLPNSFSYVLLIILRYISPFFIAEKLLLIVHFVITPLFFRRVVMHFNGNAGVLTWIIFPFTHFSLLYMGFFNFCIGVAVFFVCIDLYLKLGQMSVKRSLMFLLMTGVLYFSHIFCFLVFVMFVGLNLFIEIISETGHGKSSFSKWMKLKLFSIILPLLPFLLMSAFFFLKRPTDLTASYLTTKEVSWFFHQPWSAAGIRYWGKFLLQVNFYTYFNIGLDVFVGKSRLFYW